MTETNSPSAILRARRWATPKAPILLAVGLLVVIGSLAIANNWSESVGPLLLARVLFVPGLAAAVVGGALMKAYISQGFHQREASGVASQSAGRVVKAALQANEDDRKRKSAAADRERSFYAEAAEKYGRLIASEVFEHRRIELFDEGYVRVGGKRNLSGGPTPLQMKALDFKAMELMKHELKNAGRFTPSDEDFVVAYDTPFEKLRSIRATTQIQDKSAGGRGLASAASFGLSDMASNERRTIFLTISTDSATHSMKQRAGLSRSADQVALKLELAGQGILDSGPTRPPAAVPAGSVSVSEQLRDLSALHRDGMLTDEEFTRAKARLLGTE